MAPLDFVFHKSMLIAVEVYKSAATKLKSCFCVAFRIQLNELNSIADDEGYK